MRLRLVYCYDAYCHWCFGFDAVIREIDINFRDVFDIEVLSGGMILPQKPAHISVMSKFFMETYKKVEAVSGISFGGDYLWHINNPEESDWFPDSEKPAVALCIFKEFFPDQQVQFASALQFALHGEGRDLCDDEAYRHLLVRYNIPQQDFYERLHSELYRQKAHDEFELVKRLKITNFPALLVQLSESRFQLITNVYTDYKTIAEKLNAMIDTGT